MAHRALGLRLLCRWHRYDVTGSAVGSGPRSSLRFYIHRSSAVSLQIFPLISIEQHFTHSSSSTLW